MKFLRTLERGLTIVETGAVGGLLIAVSAVVLLQVLMRYVVAQPNPWSEELSRFGFLWMSLLGASLAVGRRAHFGFNRALAVLPEGARRLVRNGARGAVLAFALLLVGTGAALVALTLDERSPALGLPYALVYAAAPVSGVFMLIHLVAQRTGEHDLPLDSSSRAARTGEAESDSQNELHGDAT